MKPTAHDLYDTQSRLADLNYEITALDYRLKKDKAHIAVEVYSDPQYKNEGQRKNAITLDVDIELGDNQRHLWDLIKEARKLEALVELQRYYVADSLNSRPTVQTSDVTEECNKTK